MAEQGVTDQGELTITATTSLSAAQGSAVSQLVAQAAGADGFEALNEAALLHVRYDRPGVRHLLATSHGMLAGYAQLNESSVDEQTGMASSVGQLVVHPRSRRVGIGAALLAELLTLSTSPLHIWALGDTEAARRLGAGHGLVVDRALLVMKRSLSEPFPAGPLPPDTAVRSFGVGRDEEAWLRLNALAFAQHPEQGQLDRADLEARMAEPWFDPEGFLLAERAGALVGFHWTKQHAGGLGEVYVLGVHPGAGGRGLGKALLRRGLEHLRSRGNDTVELYVEADHARAVALYAGYGFSVASRDVMYAQPIPPETDVGR